MRSSIFQAFTLVLTVAGLAVATNVHAQQCHLSKVHHAQAPTEFVVITSVAHRVVAAEKDIVDTAVAAKGFNTLVAAVKAAGLVDALKSNGPFTVFAPTDEAFAALPEGTLETLLKPENKDKLAAILKYHVVSGKVMAGDVLKAMQVDTLQGSTASIGLTIGGANVVATDIKCSNGVIHVIDKVILPPKE